MKILQLCNKPPLPALDGGALAMHAITQGLLEAGHSVRVLAFATHKHPDLRSRIPQDYLAQTQFKTVFADTRVKATSAFLNLFSGESYNVARFDTAAMHAEIASILRSEKFDIIHLESLFLLPYIETIRQHSQAAVVLRAHNVEFRIWERMAAENSGLRSRYFRLLAKRLKRYETQHLNDADGIAAITVADADLFRELGCRVPVTTIPFALPLPESSDADLNDDIFHLGSMDWMPNVQAIDWFLQQCWPFVLQENKHAALFLAGREMPERFVSGNGVTIDGTIENATDYMLSHGIMIVPLQSGSGMRIKVAEGMALGRAVVSTSTGIEGIPAIEGKHVLLADTPEAFAKAILRLQQNPALRQQIGQNARLLVKEIFDRKRVTENLLDFYRQVQR